MSDGKHGDAGVSDHQGDMIRKPARAPDAPLAKNSGPGRTRHQPFAQHFDRTAECPTEFAPQPFALRLIPACCFFALLNGFFEEQNPAHQRCKRSSILRMASFASTSFDCPDSSLSIRSAISDSHA